MVPDVNSGPHYMPDDLFSHSYRRWFQASSGSPELRAFGHFEVLKLSIPRPLQG